VGYAINGGALGFGIVGWWRANAAYLNLAPTGLSVFSFLGGTAAPTETNAETGGRFAVGWRNINEIHTTTWTPQDPVGTIARLSRQNRSWFR
jgi:hypothetical protein